MTTMDTVAATTMKVVCGKEELAEKLQVVGRGVSTRTSVQILAGVQRPDAGAIRRELCAGDVGHFLRRPLFNRNT